IYIYIYIFQWRRPVLLHLITPSPPFPKRQLSYPNKMAPPSRNNSIKPPFLVLKTRRPAVVLPHIAHATPMQQAAIAELERQFALTEEVCRELGHSFLQEMKKGLKKDDQMLKMLPSYVTGYPTGEEQGTYLALEISGMDVYVCQVKLKGERGKLSINQYQYRIPEDLTNGEDVSVVLDYLTDCVADFLSRVGSQDLFVYSMGLRYASIDIQQYPACFGFPVHQVGLNKGKMLEWGHGFYYPNVVGRDIVELLHQSFGRKGLAVRIVALANDPAGFMRRLCYALSLCMILQ
ncbi:hexokinase-domain-containing protein, partial [Jimgerdemannia flammicorona]